MTKALGRIFRKVVSGLAEAWAAARDRDWARLLLLSNRTLPPSLFRLYIVVITRSHSIPNLPSAHNVVYRRLDRDEPLPPASLPAMEWGNAERLRARFQEFLSAGYTGFVAEIDGRIVAYAWVAYGRYHISEVDYELSLAPDEAFTFYSGVAPEYRYSRVYVGLAKYVLSYLQSRGIRRFVGWGSPENPHSVRTHVRMGYEIAGWVASAQCPFGTLQLRRMQAEGGKIRWRVGAQRLSRQPIDSLRETAP